jgi:rhodanese-related sulfurtransferase
LPKAPKTIIIAKGPFVYWKISHQRRNKKMPLQEISPRELYDLKSAGQAVDLIDVRTPVEFREVHAECARNVPLDALSPAQVMQGRNGQCDRPLYVICRSGARGKQACEKIAAAGFPAVVNIQGGTLAWVAAGLPVVRGKKGISLERQVRIAAGLLVLVGVVLGWQIHAGCLGLSAFVGAGLVYAGLTDRCGMGLLLARMPWNRGTDAAAGCGCKGPKQ